MNIWSQPEVCQRLFTSSNGQFCYGTQERCIFATGNLVRETPPGVRSSGAAEPPLRLAFGPTILQESSDSWL